jgi:hypothetical protein
MDPLDRRGPLATLAAGAAAAAAPVTVAGAEASGQTPAQFGLAEPTFRPLPLEHWSDRSRPVPDHPAEPITPIPYGCTDIRFTEFPKVSAS